MGNRITIQRVAAAAAVALTVVAAGYGIWNARAAEGRGLGAAAHARTARAATPARVLPGVYLGAMAGPWAGPKVRPRTLLLGADWTVEKLRWADWTQQHADGRGYVLDCQGGGGPCEHFWAAIRTWHVQEHHGARYFAIMTITGRHGHVTRLVMNTKLGWWQKAHHR